jgi:phosphonate transport system substrate-binding protein
MLWEAGVNIDKLASHAFLTSHHNVALGVLIGDYDAGAVKEEVFYKYEKRGLRTIAKTPFISEHLFITRSTLPPEAVNALRKALYDLKDDEEGMVIMSKIKSSMTAMVPVSDTDYDNLRIIIQTLEKLGIQP